MKCTNCGAELKVGCIYCSVCGHEAQIVPDYNILEDDLLKSLLEDENQKKQPDTKKQAGTKKQTKGKSPQNNPKNKKKKGKKKWILPCVIIVIIIIAGISFFAVKQSQQNSFSYQYEKGVELVKSSHYDEAKEHFKRALDLEPDNKKVMLELARLGVKMKDRDLIEGNALQILQVDPKNKEAIQLLIDLYNSEKKYDKIVDLYETYADTAQASLFADYVVAEPEFDTVGGTYHEEMEVGISAASDCEIYYTVNGDSDPITNGRRYSDPVPLTEGKTTIYAVAKDSRGIYSEIVRADYEIVFEAPLQPTVSLRSGSYTSPQMITVRVPQDCTVYYTWDGSTPNTDSSVYTAPLEMPVGNNVLSLLAVNKHGLSSGVIRYNYIYLP
ncbi:MAG: chitobiase/beta-hexosaminidase C-terminal domain-containing protein [Lachnospiraceae bacterium]|nr:chitobiase/beta-hexosaminidase C-terminal domain-containing protein [Lachnospiraceae bacterium]